MTTERAQHWSVVFAAAAWLATAAAVGGIFVFDEMLRHVGRADLAQLTSVDQYVFVVATASAGSVGAGLALRRPRHPLGWVLPGFGTVDRAVGVRGRLRRLRGPWPSEIVADGEVRCGLWPCQLHTVVGAAH